MSDYFPFIVLGVVTGSIYGLSAIGLVLTYKTSGVFNIGHGAVSAAGAYTFYGIKEDLGVPWPLAALLILLVFGPLLGLLLERLAVALAPVTTAYKIVGTVGLLLAIRAVIQIAFGEQGLGVDPFLPQSVVFTLGGVGVNAEALITLFIGIAASAALFVFFRISRLGTAMRGVVDNPQLLSMSGTSPTRVRRASWVIGSSFAAASGVLFASNQTQLEVNVLSLLVVQAFGAATIGRFQSLPLSFVGGIAVGVLQKIVAKATSGSEALQGLDLAVPVLVLFVGLLVIPRRKLVEIGQVVRPRPLPTTSSSGRTRAVSLGVVTVVALALPVLVGSKLPGYNVALSQVGLFASLHLLVRTSGQISLCHVGFAAVGAAGFAHSLGDGLPWFLALLFGGLVCLPVALLLSIPAIRLSGLYLALSTLGFGIVLSQFAYSKSFMFGGGGLPTRRPSGFTSDTSFYYVLLAIAVATVLLVLLVERSRLGRLLRAMSDSPLALATLGTSVNVSRVLVFCLSGFLAGISGGLFASLFGSTSQDSFFYLQSVLVLAVLALAGRKIAVAAFVAPASLYVIPLYITNPQFSLILQLVFGLGAIVAAASSQGGLSDVLGRRAEIHAARARSPESMRRQRARAGAIAPQQKVIVDERRLEEVR